MAEVEETLRSLVKVRGYADYVFLGQGPFFGVAQESMLKVKEMSCSYAQAFHTLEFRHGPARRPGGSGLRLLGHGPELSGPPRDAPLGMVELEVKAQRAH